DDLVTGVQTCALPIWADIITLRGDVPNAVPAPDPHSHLVYSASGGDVETVVVDGRVLVRRGEFVSLDADRIRHELGRIRAKLVEIGRASCRDRVHGGV